MEISGLSVTAIWPTISILTHTENLCRKKTCIGLWLTSLGPLQELVESSREIFQTFFRLSVHLHYFISSASEGYYHTYSFSKISIYDQILYATHLLVKLKSLLRHIISNVHWAMWPLTNLSWIYCSPTWLFSCFKTLRPHFRRHMWQWSYQARGRQDGIVPWANLAQFSFVSGQQLCC